MKALHGISLRRALAALALCVGGLAAFVGTPRPPLGAEEVSAEELGQWIHDRRPGLVVLDARDAAAMQKDGLPGAQPMNEIDGRAIAPDDTVVVYSDRYLPAQTIESLRQRLKVRRVLPLRGGIVAWNADVLFPTLRSDASARQQRAFALRAQLSRYFGGTPRVLDRDETRQRTQGRRGC